jgi:ribonuclease R
MRQKILTGISIKGYKPIGWETLAAGLGVNKNDYERFRKEIDDLHRSGRLVIGEDMTIRLSAPEGTVVGTFRKNMRGFGFVIPGDPEVLEDLYIAKTETKDAISGDIVLARISRRRVGGQSRLYGRIEKILARGKNKFTGHLAKAAQNWIVQTDGRVLHQPIMVGDVSAKGGRTGDRVVVQLTEYPEGDQLPRGVILEILGAAGEPNVELQAVIEEFDLPREFPDEVQADLENVVADFNRKTGKMLAKGNVPKNRLDLRGKVTVTIDPVDARDFDDAITLEVNDKGYELGVHIADVSAFVREDSPLDTEARDRGNSVYLPRLVLPMIPEALSNGLCSLQEGQDRLTKSAFIRFNKKGKVVGSRYANSVIRSTKRLTYEQATDILKGTCDGVPPEVVELVLNAEKLAKIIYQRRADEGMLHLDLPEVELEYNEKGELIDAHPADMSFSHTIIEMFMVEANEAVARLLDSYGLPFVRRIHPDPSPQALTQLGEFLTVLGHKVSKTPERTELQALINSVEGKPQSFAVSYAILRSLQRAEYSPKTVGHFALASKHYCHFTSPIRRYPDLHVHRFLDLHFEGKLKGMVDRIRQDKAVMFELGEHCSFTEDRAANAERQIKETLIIQMLSAQIGQEFDGIVTGVSTIGLFVRLPKYLIEGLIPVEELGDDWWEINKEKGFVRGQRSGVRFRIGDLVRFVIVTADPISRKMNFALVEKIEPAGKGRGKPLAKTQKRTTKTAPQAQADTVKKRPAKRKRPRR